MIICFFKTIFKLLLLQAIFLPIHSYDIYLDNSKSIINSTSALGTPEHPFFSLTNALNSLNIFFDNHIILLPTNTPYFISQAFFFLNNFKVSSQDEVFSKQAILQFTANGNFYFSGNASIIFENIKMLSDSEQNILIKSENCFLFSFVVNISFFISNKICCFIRDAGLQK